VSMLIEYTLRVNIAKHKIFKLVGAEDNFNLLLCYIIQTSERFVLTQTRGASLLVQTRFNVCIFVDLGPTEDRPRTPC